MATISGQWGPTNVPNTATTFDSHTIEEVGEYTITHTATSSGNPIAFGSAIRTPHSTATSPNQNPATTTLTEQLQPGDLIEFRASSINASIGTGTWSITSDAFADPLPPNAVSPDQIGGVYVGDELAQALYHGSVLLWRRNVAVTPVAPTFHDGEPWITLPTVEGVTYSVSGTPGYNASVTVTATAQPGYELVGTASWSHTYGPAPSIYPLSGGWGPQKGFGGVRDRHTMVEGGMFRITHTLSTISGTGGGTIEAAISAPGHGVVTGPNSPTSTLTVEWSLQENTFVEFRVSTGPASVNATGTWLIERI